MTNPFFSIIIPTYNRAYMIGHAIQSVLEQSFSDWELIIIDDGSTDNTKDLVKKYADERIKYIYQTNAERSAARNNGIRHANGQYFCFLDSDDYYLGNRLKDLYDHIITLEYPIAMLYTGICLENNEGIRKRPQILYREEENKFDFILQAVIGTPQACIHRDILKQHLFNPAIVIGEDMELWLRIINKYPLYYIDTYSIVAKEHENRSVNEKKYNSYAIQFQMLKFAFASNHPGHQASKAVKRQLLSSCCFGQARYYMYNKIALKAIYWLIRSIVYDISNLQTKHKLYCICSLLPIMRFLIKNQYQ